MMVLLERIPKISWMLGRLLLRLPFREVWLSVAVLMVVGENYPFSNFPMYSNLEEEATYFVVVNARDEIMPYVPNFRSRSSYVPKALKTERRKLEKQGLTSEVALREAGKSVLLSLVQRAEPQKREDLLGKGLKLVEVRISVGSSRLQEEQTVVAEILPSH
ncbi:MAG TPA: hypothetical protein VIS99_16345 [Terrimicrobiaceae bacterium]